jgi:hypothetical protein
MSMLPLNIWRHIYNNLDFTDQFALMQSFKILFDAFGTEYMKELLDVNEHNENTISKIDSDCLNDMKSWSWNIRQPKLCILRCEICNVYTYYLTHKLYESKNGFRDVNESFCYALPYLNDDGADMTFDIYCQRCFDIDRICSNDCNLIVLNYDAASKINLCEICKKK